LKLKRSQRPEIVKRVSVFMKYEANQLCIRALSNPDAYFFVSWKKRPFSP
jgi:hypothetical protein